jgi:hypothetical protein
MMAKLIGLEYVLIMMFRKDWLVPEITYTKSPDRIDATA